jgi:glucokinase
LAQPLPEDYSWREVSVDTNSPASAAKGLSKVIREVVAHLGEDRVIGVGIGVPAIINSVTMQIVGSNPLNWSGPAQFGSIIRERVTPPVLVTQRVMAAAWAEHMFGSGRDAHTLLYARFGSGIATGIILNDQIYTGSSYMAGDIASMTVMVTEPNLARTRERDLKSQREGWLQNLVSRDAIVRRTRQLLLARRQTLPDMTLEGICRAANAGHEVATSVIEEAGHYIGIALSNLIGILNPEVVALGGPLTEGGNTLLNAVSHEVQARCSPYAYSAVKVFLSTLGDRAAAWGAASLALQQFLSPTGLPDLRMPLAS